MQPAPTVTNRQPPLATGNEIHDGADSYFDFDIPSSPVEEAEYARLVDTSTTTPQENAPESGYVCASPISSVDNSAAVEHSDTSSDEPFFDPEGSDIEQRSLSLSIDYYDCDELKREPIPQTHQITDEKNVNYGCDSSSSSTESLPKSQSTTLSTFTAHTSESNNTIGTDIDMPEFCVSAHLSSDLTFLNDDLDNNESKNNHSETQSKRTNSISTNELILEIGEVPEIPKYDSTASKTTLQVENFVNGHTSDNDIDDDEEQIPRQERFRRCSSLKSGKTPPGTPGRKKIVRFADVLGLDLADVRTFMDEIPKVPKSAYDELTVPEPEPPIMLGQRYDKVIVPLFQQPGALPHFLEVVQAQNVALENAAVTDPVYSTITGVVRVRNLDFHKSVHVRYTLDKWQSYSDLQAEYVDNSCDGFSDKFTFTIFGNSMEVGQRIEIALRFSCKGEQFWDNNYGINYCFQCMPATSSHLQTADPTQNDISNDQNVQHDAWYGSSFY